MAGIQTTGKQEEYTAATGANITGDIDPDSGFDTARVVMGGGWRMPTADECQELIDNTTFGFVYDGHRSGAQLAPSVRLAGYVHLPTAGAYVDGTLHYAAWDGYRGFFHASTGEGIDGWCDYLAIYARVSPHCEVSYGDAYIANSVRGVLSEYAHAD